MAKRLHFREMPAQVKDAIDQIQRGEFSGQILSASGFNINTRTNERRGLLYGQDFGELAGYTTGIQFETTGSAARLGFCASTKMISTIRDTEYMRFVRDHEVNQPHLCSGQQDEIIFNVNSDDIDFIVKGDNDANLIKVQASLDTIGIGVADPRAKLQIEFDNNDTWSSSREYADYPLLLKNNSDTLNAFTGIAFDVSTQTDRDAIGAAIVALNRHTSDFEHHADLVFATNFDDDDDLTERMRITDEGLVGIGVASPQSKLHIEHTDTTNWGSPSDEEFGNYLLTLRNNTDEIGAFSGIAFDISTETDADSIGAAIVGINQIGSDSTHDTDLVFATNDAGDDTLTERMRIEANGQIGIGVNNPLSRLHIEHTDSTTWASPSNETFNDFILTLRNNTNTVDAFAGIAFDVSTESDLDSIGAAILAVNKNTTSTLHDTDLVFATNEEDSSNPGVADDQLTERMRITSDGQVGIGTNDPDLGDDVGLHILANSGAGQGNLRVECTESSIDIYQSLINCQWPNDSSIQSTRYWIKFVNGDGQVGSINGEVNYSPFTGQHNTLVPSGSIRQGMILKSTGEVFYRTTVSNAWVVTETTTVEKDKAVTGVYAGLAISAEESVVGEELAAYNAVGEGSILVTDAGGNIETGDYICSSNNLGHGMKQDDDLLHNYTVAKANEPIDFSTVEVDPELGFKSFLLACTYHCG
tara:strand:+ start:526 stop:2625 length:2100 start_codon:yes stop_codon:yes gene_type:complete